MRMTRKDGTYECVMEGSDESERLSACEDVLQCVAVCCSDESERLSACE